MDHFSVELDQPLGVYLPGQNISGSVRFRLTVPESFKGLTVECVGKSQVHWSETEAVGRETETVHYQASENYFYHKVLLFGGNEVEFEAGTHRYTFSFTLPHQLPPSFEGAHGSLRYYVRATLGRRYMLDAVFKRGFSVNTIVDLNQHFQASIPVKNEETKTVCCLCCQSGPITAVAWLPKSGYVPGETILFCGRVDNQSRSRLLHTSVRLVEVQFASFPTSTSMLLYLLEIDGLTCENNILSLARRDGRADLLLLIERLGGSVKRTIFKAQGKQKEDERVIVEITRTQQSDRDILDVWNNIPIVVPPLAPSDLQHCTTIDLRYYLEFIVNPGALSFNFKVPIEIVIGTVPFQDSFTTFQQPVQPSTPLLFGEENGLLQPIGFLPQLMMNQYPNLPSPTYETGLFSGNLREEGDTEHLNIGFDTLFKPLYISYASSNNQSLRS